MAQFDANINLRVVASEAEKKLKQFEKKLQSLEKRTLSRAKKNEGLASNLITGGKAAGQSVGVRLQRQQAKAAQDALRVADARVEKELRLAAAMQRQETILKALNRAGGAQSKAAQERVTDALAASKEAKNNLGIQNAVNTLLEKELQIRREINRTRLAADEARSTGATRGGQISGLEGRGGAASKIAELRALNNAYVAAAEKGETDIAKAIDRRFKRKFELLKRDVAATEAAAKSEITSYTKADKVIRRLRVNRLREQKRAGQQLKEDLALGVGFPLLFGGGAGSVLGGAAGALAGGGKKGGFGKQILFSAVGQAFDGLIASGLELAKALNKPLENIDSLLDALPRLDAPTKALIADLRAAGLEASAAAIVVDQFNERLKTLGVTDVDKFKRDTKEFQNAVKDLEVAAGILASSKFIGIINLIKDGFLILSKLEPSGPLQRAAGGALAQRDLQEGRGTTGTPDATAASQRQLDIASRFAILEQQSVDIQREREALITRSINMSAEQLAVAQAELKLSEAENKADRLNLEYEQAKGTEKEANAYRAVEEANAAERTARATRNQLQALQQIAQVQASRTIRRAEIGTNTQLDALKLQQVEQSSGRLAAIQKERQLLKESINDKIELINLERAELLEANKGRGLDEQINALAERKILLAQEANRLTDEELAKKAKLLTLERELDSIRVATAQRLQLAESGEGLARAELELANPFGGDAYEKELQRLDQIKELRDIALGQEAQMLSLKEKLAKADPEDKGRIANQIAMQEKVNETIRNEALARQEVERAILSQQQILEKLQPITDGLAAGITDFFTSVIDGSKSAEEAFADMLKGMGQALIQQAAIMIAQYIAIGIARAFAGMGSSTPKIGTDTNYFSGGFTPMDFFRAEGGPVQADRPYVVGERGPEFFVPSQSGSIVTNEQSKAAMSRYSASNDNTRAQQNSPIVANVNYNGPMLNFNGDDYIPRSEASSLVKAGAKQGEALTLARLQNSRSSRAKLGL